MKESHKVFLKVAEKVKAAKSAKPKL
jgi:hypothetical protein